MIDKCTHSGAAIVRLTLSFFRCYAYLRLEMGQGPVILTGPNGSGKTSILEAISFLAPGRGLKRARLADVQSCQTTARNHAGWALSARIIREDGQCCDIGTGRANVSEKRLLKIDGQSAKSQAMLLEIVSILWLTPAMDRLFSEGAGGRRRFLDRLVLGIDQAHGKRAAAYDHAMRERNRLLSMGHFDPTWLDVLEENLIIYGIEMSRARNILITKLNEACSQGIGPFPAASLSLLGKDNDWSQEDASSLRQKLSQKRSIDATAGTMTSGPHRSDVAVHHAEKDLPASFCSTGEQKAILVAILLGQARLQKSLSGRSPILLLDEVTAHLDHERRNALYDELTALSSQSWMTGTDPSLFADMQGRGQFFHVEDKDVRLA